jgi:large subunit ribosomal protein L31
MKKGTHPKYYPDAQVTCACGHAFETGSTQPEIKVEICSQCHPFFTGQMRYIDTMGRVEKFQKKQAAAKKKQYVKKTDRQREKTKAEGTQPTTLKEMIQQERKKIRQ